MELKKYHAIMAVAVVLTLLTVGSGYAFVNIDGNTVYEYSIKTEQVNDNSLLEENETIPIEDLSQDEQDMLYHAFKKSDHFLDGAQVVIETDEDLNYSSEWRLVSMDGVMFVTAMQEHDTYTDMGFKGFVSMLTLCISGIMAFFMWIHAIEVRSEYKN